MNRKDFLRSLIAGAAIAPTLFTAKADPVETANDFIAISNVDNPVSFSVTDISIHNDIVTHWIGDYEQVHHLVGRDVTLHRVDVSHIGNLESLIMDRNPRNYVITLPKGILVFSARMSSFIYNESTKGYEVELYCTAPEMKYHKI